MSKNRSVMTEKMNRCFLCDSRQWIEIHHVFGGANRKNSDKYGLVVPLCHYCHNEPPHGVHFDERRRLGLQARAQRVFESIEDHDKFIKIFGPRDYIETYRIKYGDEDED